MRVDWDAVSAISAVFGVLVAVGALVSSLSQRARLRSRLRHTLELLAALPPQRHDELRRTLNAIVDVTAARLLQLEGRWLASETKTGWRPPGSTLQWWLVGILATVPLGGAVLVLTDVLSSSSKRWVPVSSLAATVGMLAIIFVFDWLGERAYKRRQAALALQNSVPADTPGQP